MFSHCPFWWPPTAHSLFIILLINHPSIISTAHHLCDCIQGAAPLGKCLNFQALTRNESHYTIIESDALYWIPETNVYLNPGVAAFYMLDAAGEPIESSGKWYNLNALKDFLTKDAQAKLTKSPHLTYYAQLRLENNTPVHDIAFTAKGAREQIRSTVQERPGGVKVEINSEEDQIAFLGNWKHLIVVRSEQNIAQGYCVYFKMGEITFMDLKGNYLGVEAAGGTVWPYDLKYLNASHARFVRKSGRPNHSMPDLLSTTAPPLGFITRGFVFLLDQAAEVVFTFEYKKLINVTLEESQRHFPYKRYSMRDYIHCKKTQATATPIRPNKDPKAQTGKDRKWFLDWRTLVGGCALAGALLLVTCCCCLCRGRRRGQGDSDRNSAIYKEIIGGSERSYKYVAPPTSGGSSSSKGSRNAATSRRSHPRAEATRYKSATGGSMSRGRFKSDAKRGRAKKKK